MQQPLPLAERIERIGTGRFLGEAAQEIVPEGLSLLGPALCFSALGCLLQDDGSQRGLAPPLALQQALPFSSTPLRLRAQKQCGIAAALGIHIAVAGCL